MIMIYVILFIAGAIAGSFLNVLIYRLPRNLSIIRPPSHCPHCTNPIRFYDNLPIISYLILRGKCRHCDHKISGRYPLVEILTGLAFVMLFYKFGWTTSAYFYGILLVYLIVIVFIDIEFHKIPNILILTGLLCGVTLLLISTPRNPIDAGLGLLVGAGIMFFWSVFGRLLFKKECLGGGDVKLAILVGLYLGLSGTILAIFISFILAGLVGIGLVLIKGLKMDGRLPYAPFLAIGAIATIVSGQPIINWYLGFL
ncbi:MAG: prepilin peptidase [Candidatus Marinimicrobia bacterium]|nr:prepilin peptidase [Candidatus Neomarinimicrobiota bacterium]